MCVPSATLCPHRGSAPLACANAALDALARALANDYGPRLRVNCLSPGLVDTEMWDSMPAGECVTHTHTHTRARARTHAHTYTRVLVDTEMWYSMPAGWASSPAHTQTHTRTRVASASPHGSVPNAATLVSCALCTRSCCVTNRRYVCCVCVASYVCCVCCIARMCAVCASCHMHAEAKAGMLKGFGSQIPAGRAGTIDDIGSAAVFLMANTWMSGAVLDVDGGAVVRP